MVRPDGRRRQGVQAMAANLLTRRSRTSALWHSEAQGQFGPNGPNALVAHHRFIRPRALPARWSIQEAVFLGHSLGFRRSSNTALSNSL